MDICDHKLTLTESIEFPCELRKGHTPPCASVAIIGWTKEKGIVRIMPAEGDKYIPVEVE